MKIFVLLLFVVLEYAGYIYLHGTNFALYTIFCSINSLFILHFCKEKVINQLVYLYVFTSWMIYIALGFLHYELVVRFPKRIEQIYLLFILGSILLFIPSLVKSKKASKPIKFITNININKKVLLILLSANIFFKILKISMAGGWESYVYAAYGSKVESSYMTFFHLFEGIFSNVTIFILPFLFGKVNNTFKIFLILYFLLAILLGTVSGSSMSVLSPLLSLFVYAFFQTRSKLKRLFYKQCLYASVALGAIAGIFIRINRTNNSEFHISSLKSAIDDVMLSPTFDNIVNFEWIITELNPTYKISQIIYPFVHFLPRSQFPWKPMELGRIVGQEFKETAEESHAGFITSALGDFYYDFGYFGIIAGMLFIGWFISKLQDRLNASLVSNNIFILPIIIAIATKLTTIAGWYTGSFRGVVNFIIYLLIIRTVQYIFIKTRR